MRAQANGEMDCDREPEALAARLTLDGKIGVLAGKKVWGTPEIDRLGIPSLKFRLEGMEWRIGMRELGGGVF